MRTVDTLKEEQTRAEIINAAQKLFQKYGLDKTTMEDIAAAAGKGKSTLYYYYPSKDDVFYAVINKERSEVLETLTTAIKYQKSPAGQLRAFFLARFYEVKRRVNLYSVMLQEGGKHPALFARIQRESNTAELEMMKKILLDGIKAEEFKSITKDDCESLALAGITMQRGLEANIVLSGELPPEELRLETTIEVFIRGLR